MLMDTYMAPAPAIFPTGENLIEDKTLSPSLEYDPDSPVLSINTSEESNTWLKDCDLSTSSTTSSLSEAAKQLEDMIQEEDDTGLPVTSPDTDEHRWKKALLMLAKITISLKNANPSSISHTQVIKAVSLVTSVLDLHKEVAMQ